MTHAITAERLALVAEINRVAIELDAIQKDTQTASFARADDPSVDLSAEIAALQQVARALAATPSQEVTDDACPRCGHRYGALTSTKGPWIWQCGRCHFQVDLTEKPAANLPHKGDEWRDIASAPKDGTFILLCVAGAVPAVGQWQKSPWGHEGWKHTEPSDFDSDDALLADWENTQWEPTHWMPLPSPPALSPPVKGKE